VLSLPSTWSAKVGAKKYDVLTPCSCRLLDGRVRKYNEAHVPGVLANASFDGFVRSDGTVGTRNHMLILSVTELVGHLKEA